LSSFCCFSVSAFASMTRNPSGSPTSALSDLRYALSSSHQAFFSAPVFSTVEPRRCLRYHARPSGPVKGGVFVCFISQRFLRACRRSQPRQGSTRPVGPSLCEFGFPCMTRMSPRSRSLYSAGHIPRILRRQALFLRLAITVRCILLPIIKSCTVLLLPTPQTCRRGFSHLTLGGTRLVSQSRDSGPFFFCLIKPPWPVVLFPSGRNIF